MKSLSRIQLFAIPGTGAYQASLSMGFSRQEYWSGLPFPSPGDLLTQRLNLGLLHCRQTLYRLSHQGSPLYIVLIVIILNQSLIEVWHLRLCCCCLVAKSCLIFVTSWTAAHQASLSLTISWSLLKFMSIVLMKPSTISSSILLLPSVFPNIRVFSNELAFHVGWPKYWSFSFNISPSSEYSGLIYFRIDWFEILPVPGTLKRLLKHHNSKASILWHPAFFIVQLSHLYMTIGKTIALTVQTCWQSNVSAF